MILNINMKEKKYDVLVKRHILKEVEKHLNLNRKVLILTDSGVPEEYANMVLKVSQEGFIYQMKAGEQSKSFENFGLILDFMIAKNFSRSDCIVAVGGGVCGDMAGFVASTYMRGIDFYNIPTTLLAQVDSSIGGKTAIDKAGIKNVVGAFYPPCKVLIDPEVLKTLDVRQLHSGLVEAIKMSVTHDEELFKIINDSQDLLADIEIIIERALLIKKQVVEADPNEKGLRKVLNFGHTIGHAIESCGALESLLHGECVGLGMLYLSSEDVRGKLEKILGKYHLPISTKIDKDELFKFISLDKKRSGNYLSIVYVSQIAHFEIKEILLDEIKEYL